MSALVMKFGGSSVGSSNALKQVLSIVQREVSSGPVMVVTSAMGGLTDHLVGLIDSAIQHDQAAIEQGLSAIEERHEAVMAKWLSEHPDEYQQVKDEHAVLLTHIRESCQRIIDNDKATPELRDAVLSTGERLMVRLLAALLRVHDIPAEYVDASDILVTDDRFQNAQPVHPPSLENARERLLPLIENGVVPVVTGYIGATESGAITTLGRGGSDYSATYLASLIDAREVWIWTDVNGVMSGDPRKLKNAKIMNSISYQAVSEFAHFGAKVLHPRAVEPLIVPKIPLRVCNTFDPDYAGTRINGHHGGKPKHLMAVTDIRGILVFAPAVPVDMDDDGPTIQEMAEQVLADNIHQQVEPVITVDSHTGRLLCYVVPTTAARSATEESVAALEAALQAHYPALEWRVEPVAIVAAIGVVDVQETMQVLSAVRSVKADLLAMGQGSPECALLVVPPQQAARVVKRLHNMAVSAHHRLSRTTDDNGLCPPVPDVPRSRKRRSSRRRRGNAPPNRGIPF